MQSEKLMKNAIQEDNEYFDKELASLTFKKISNMYAMREDITKNHL